MEGPQKATDKSPTDVAATKHKKHKVEDSEAILELDAMATGSSTLPAEHESPRNELRKHDQHPHGVADQHDHSEHLDEHAEHKKHGTQAVHKLMKDSNDKHVHEIPDHHHSQTLSGRVLPIADDYEDGDIIIRKSDPICDGAYRPHGTLNNRPRYKHFRRTAIIYFSFNSIDDTMGRWKMNVRDDTSEWCYAIDSTDLEPPCGTYKNPETWDHFDNPKRAAHVCKHHTPEHVKKLHAGRKARQHKNDYGDDDEQPPTQSAVVLPVVLRGPIAYGSSEKPKEDRYGH